MSAFAQGTHYQNVISFSSIWKTNFSAGDNLVSRADVNRNEWVSETSIQYTSGALAGNLLEAQTDKCIMHPQQRQPQFWNAIKMHAYAAYGFGAYWLENESVTATYCNHLSIERFTTAANLVVEFFRETLRHK